MNIFFVAAFGLVMGSFINALVWRLHSDIPILNAKARSKCPHCQHVLAPSDLVPVLSYLFLGGRCRYCSKRISLQYPAVELTTAVLFVLAYLNLPVVSAWSLLQLVVVLGMIVCGVAMSVYDLRWMLLPDRLQTVLLVFGVIYLLGNIAAGGVGVLTSSLLALAVFGGLFYALIYFSDGKLMGGGDVKLIFIVSITLGFQLTLVALFVAFNVAAAVSLGLMAKGKRTLKQVVPFGPFLVLGLFTSLFYGPRLIDIYLSWAGLA